MPRRYARILNQQFNNRLLPFPLDVPAFDTYVYWHANTAGDPANEWLREQLFKALRGGASSARSVTGRRTNAPHPFRATSGGASDLRLMRAGRPCNFAAGFLRQ